MYVFPISQSASAGPGEDGTVEATASVSGRVEATVPGSTRRTARTTILVRLVCQVRAINDTLFTQWKVLF
jgi:hypothetical protein